MCIRDRVYFKGKDKKSGTVKAVDDVSFHIMKGETFGVVGAVSYTHLDVYKRQREPLPARWSM